VPAALAELERRLKRNLSRLKNDFHRFVPRADCAEEYDQQTSWYYSQATVACCVAGNRSGKTHSSAAKLVRLITQDHAPPAEGATFLVVSDSFEQVINICWKEKLRNMLPEDSIDWRHCQWYNNAGGMPKVIRMKPWPGSTNYWQIEFRSAEQGRRHFQGRTYYGLWVSEQLSWEIIEEIRRGMVDHPLPGTCYLEFTPLDPDITIGLEERMEAASRGDPSVKGWEFYQLNADKNTHINQEAMQAYLASVSPEIRETRRIGKLASFAGAVFPNWNPRVHLLNERQWKDITGYWPPERGCATRAFKASMPPAALFRRGIDWGESLEHSFACVWGYKLSGRWFIFDEFVDNLRIDYDWRANEILDRYPWPLSDPNFGQTYADPSRPYLLSFMGGKGISMQGANNSIEGFETVRRLMEPRPTGLKDDKGKPALAPNLYVLRGDSMKPEKPGCPILARQIWKLRYLRSVKPGKMDTRVNRNKAANEIQDWDNDACDAFRYMIHSDTPYEGAPPDSMATYDDPSRFGLHIRGRFKERTGER
jgi:hypothetical protein